ncbi:MAG TPA: asparaginase [Lentisphaeria bacterium]|nr:MAG: asparaginase [Lentisphaerae bacterium GWF2_49_21]HBC89500.1 asparaginase [Lentisphaeria bacterium]
MKIAVFATGGTFDKEYNELNGKLYFKQTHIPEMLAFGRSRVPVRIQTIMMKDSLDMTVSDRQKIVLACRKAKEDRIVITHGTDTMEITARFLAKKLSGKVVVLTGAMVPYKFGSSDGLFNLGSALAFAQVLAPGVYVAMNGRCFAGDSVSKNRVVGVFENKRPNFASA